MRVNRLPFDPGPPAWEKILPTGDAYPKLKERKTVDFAIVGAGFSGLSAARALQLIDPSCTIAIVEAREIAEGPAGRNSGFMIDIPDHLASKNYSGTLKTDRRQIELNREAIEFANQIANDFSMADEAFAICGKINAAATAAGMKNNQKFAVHLNQLGEANTLLDEYEMHEISGSHCYRSGLFTPYSAMIQPALYFRELVRGIHTDRTQIFENSPVVGIENSGSAWNLQTPEGVVSAGKVILTINGHIESFGFFKQRLMHIYLYASMTRQLDRDEVSILGGKPRWGFRPADPFGTTVRRISGTGGDRIIVRNGFTWAPNRTVSDEKPGRMARVHDQSFRRRFPDLASIEMEYRWGGLLCMSSNSVPAFGELEPNLYSACCQNGLGVVNGTLYGKLIAELACGQASSSLEFVRQLPQPKQLIPEPLVSIGANIVMKWGELKAGRER